MNTIKISGKVVKERELAFRLRKDCGVDAYPLNTGGFGTACAIAVPGAHAIGHDPSVPDEMLVVYDPCVGSYALSAYSYGKLAEVDYAQMTFSTDDELLAWVEDHPDLVVHLDDARQEG